MSIQTEKQLPKPSKIPGPAASVISIVPGLGQIFVGMVRRGFLLIVSFATILGLAAWRVHLLAHREPTALAKLSKAVDRRPLFIGLVIGLIIVIWLWNIWDAYRQASRKERGAPGIFILIVAAFFALGWQISEIDLKKAVTELPDAWPPLSKVLWPWEAAVIYRTEAISARSPIVIGCDEGELPEENEPEEGVPYITTEPRCGDLSEMDKNNEIVPGTKITVSGKNFDPNTLTDIWWRDPIGNEFRPRAEGDYIRITTDDRGSFEFEMVMPYRLIPPSAKGQQVHHILARQEHTVGGPLPSEPLLLTIERMVETIVMGMMATIFGIFFSIPISFLAARNLMSGSWFTMAIYYVTRTILNVIRAIEPLIWALIAVVWVGLGPFAGIIALTIHSIAALGKLYSEAIENIDPGPIEAIQATGATKLQTIMYAVVPQMISPFVSFSIYRWDINVRMSTVIGLVGGGGIGFLLVQYIRLLDYRSAGLAVWFIAITVAILDYVSSEIRNRFV
jgi:phosphonate transport system permease protein